MKKLAVLFFIVCLIASLYGCGGGAIDYFGISHQDIVKRDYTIINASGRFSKPITFPSGATINTTEDNTLAKNVKVNVTETMTGNIGVNPIGKPDYIYVYDIKAELAGSDGIAVKAPTLEKPLQLTLPTTHLDKNGIYYAGIRDDKNSPWKYIRLSDDGSVSLMAPATFELYRMGVQVALFSYNKPAEEAKNDISVAGMVATVTPLLEYDDEEKYLNDLAADIKLTGTNLSGLSGSDLAVSIIYRTTKSTPVTIKANGFTCSQISEKNSDAAVAGNNYFVHTLKVAEFDATFGGEAEIKFALDLKGISRADFPTDFMLEVSSVDGNLENLISFRYSTKISFKAEKAKVPDPEPTVYTITYDLDGGSLVSGDTNPDCYSEASDTIILKNPVKAGYTFAGWTGTGLSVATMEVTIEKASTGNREYKATWTENAPDTYTLTVTKGTGIATVSEGAAYEAGKEITLEYTLEGGYEFASWTSDDVTVTDNKFIMPAKAVTVTANASVITYNLTYAGLEGATFADGDNPVTFNVESEDITLKNPTKAGYTFKGWSGSDLTGDENLTVTIAKGSTGDKTYTANWTLTSYTITYEGIEGATFADGDNPVTYDVASDAITLKNPTKAGYTFKGWSGSDLTGGENLTVTITKGSTGDKTYTANWTPVSYTITYGGIEGAIFADGVTNPVSYDVTSATITLNNPTKANYDFLGWTGTGIASDTASMTVTIPQGSVDNRAYVASWAVSVMTFTLPGGVELEVRRCPAGSFVRSGRDGYGDGNTVTLTKDFYMGTYQVTNAQYVAIMGGSSPSSGSGSDFTGDNQPVVISWNDITAVDGFIDRMNSQFASQLPDGYKFALPTEAQWEYACRAGTTTDFNNGKPMIAEDNRDSNLDEVAWYWQNWGESYERTHDVGCLASNSFGLYDMHGNVWEWCADWYSDYDSSNLTDPTGPAEYDPSFGSGRVLRGGSWYGDPYRCTSWYRSSSDPDFRNYNYGFRLALVPVPILE